MNDKFLPGREYVLKVVRQSELGAFLDAGTGNTSDDILLHKAQQTREVHIGEDVRVGLYLDPKSRLAASMKLSRIKEGEIGLATVLSITAKGGFVDTGAERGVFLPFSQMRGKIFPGQTVWVKLYTDKSGRGAVTMLVEDELKQKSVQAKNVKKGDVLTGRVYNVLDDGWLIFTNEAYIAFMHKDEAVSVVINIGDEITGRITYIRDDGRVNISQREQKEAAIPKDAERIITLLKERNGRMPYSDSTPPEIIKDKFGCSKAAFKRALGQLLKQDLIEQKDGWTMLK